MEWIEVGRLTRTHGLKGELKFQPTLTDPDLVQEFHRARIEGDAETASREIESIRGHGDRLILKLKGIDRIEDAEPLTGRALLIHQEDFTPLPDGEYYWFQIEGLRAYDEAGTYYGTVTEIIETGSNDVYVVREGERELLLPVIDSVVKRIDLAERKLIFHPIEGLLEDHPV